MSCAKLARRGGKGIKEGGPGCTSRQGEPPSGLIVNFVHPGRPAGASPFKHHLTRCPLDGAPLFAWSTVERCANQENGPRAAPGAHTCPCWVGGRRWRGGPPVATWPCLAACRCERLIEVLPRYIRK